MFICSDVPAPHLGLACEHLSAFFGRASDAGYSLSTVNTSGLPYYSWLAFALPLTDRAGSLRLYMTVTGPQLWTIHLQASPKLLAIFHIPQKDVQTSLHLFHATRLQGINEDKVQQTLHIGWKHCRTSPPNFSDWKTRHAVLCSAIPQTFLTRLYFSKPKCKLWDGGRKQALNLSFQKLSFPSPTRLLSQLKKGHLFPSLW